MSQLVHRPCHLCEASCGLTFEVEGERLLAARNDPSDPFSRGYCCPKGLAIPAHYHDPDRLRRPLIRRWGELVECGWEEALEAAAAGLADVIRRRGPHALATYVGNPTVHNLGAMLGTEVWRRALPSRNRYTANSQDVNPHLLVNLLVFGMQLAQPVPDLERTRYLLIVGANPLVSNGSLMTAPGIGRRLKAIQARGGKVVVLDPRRTETARIACEHHFVWPGQDALLLLALAQVILAEGLEDADFLARWGRPGVRQRLRDLLEPFTPEAAAPRVGPAFTPAHLRRLARELAGAQGGAVYARLGPCNSAQGGLAVWATLLLNVLSGNLDRIGGSLFPEGLASWLFRLPGARGSFDSYRSPQGAPELNHEYPCRILADQIERGLSDPSAPEAVFALVSFAGNPLLSVPNARRLRAACERLEFQVAVDIYPSETARLADVVLPPRSSLHEPFFDPVAPHFAVEDTARWAPPLLPPPPDQPSEYELITGLAQRVARELGPLRGARAALLRAAAAPARAVPLLVRGGPRGARLNPLSRRVTLKQLRRAPHGLAVRPLRAGRLRQRIFQRDGRLDLTPEPLLRDLERLRRALAEPPPGARPLRLIGRRQLKSNNSWLHNLPGLQAAERRCTLLVHPADAERAGVGPGAARLIGRVGELEVEVELSEEIAPGVVSLPHGWGHASSGWRVALERPGVNVNELSDEERYDPLTQNSALNGVPVELAPLGEP